MFPYADNYVDADDDRLVDEAVKGSHQAVSQLVTRHQRFIYNVALKYIRDVDGAQDLTQDVLIKMVTRLHQFQHQSRFRIWLYRMVFHAFLNSERKKAEQQVYSFDELADYVDQTHTEEGMSESEQVTYSRQISEVRNRCMTSTLLCLSREQRLVLILGSIFSTKSPVAAELLAMTPENFRKQLSRAKTDLFNFMNNRCGLIDPTNACRCHKKTKGFIKEGLVNAKTGQFFEAVTEAIREVVDQKNNELDYLMEQKYLILFTNQPYEKIDKNRDLAQYILEDPLVLNLFEINGLADDSAIEA